MDAGYGIRRTAKDVPVAVRRTEHSYVGRSVPVIIGSDWNIGRQSPVCNARRAGEAPSPLANGLARPQRGGAGGLGRKIRP